MTSHSEGRPLRIDCVVGDITRTTADAIVNAANRSLMGGGGVDGAIHRAAGPDLLTECQALRRAPFKEGLPTGHCVVTPAYGIRTARCILHTVGPIYADHDPKEAGRLLRSCHETALQCADALALDSVAFPAISTGVYGYPLKDAAEVAVGAVLSASTRVKRVTFVLFDEKALSAFREALQERS